MIANDFQNVKLLLTNFEHNCEPYTIHILKIILCVWISYYKYITEEKKIEHRKESVIYYQTDTKGNQT